MAWLAFLCAYFVLNSDLRRRRLRADAMNVILVLVIAGLVGSKLYHVLEEPSQLIADPVGLLFSSYGFAWFGGFLAGLAALIGLARHYRIQVLAFLDACSPAAALGYAIGRIGCLLSGDGDYGIPTHLPWGMGFPHGLVPTPPGVRVHPTPIYEFIVGVVIAWYLWKRGARLLRERSPAGELLAEYLILTGIARFLVEFIRINPRTFLGVLSNAQVVSLASILAGSALMALVRSQRKSAVTPALVGKRSRSQTRRTSA